MEVFMKRASKILRELGLLIVISALIVFIDLHFKSGGRVVFWVFIGTSALYVIGFVVLAIYLFLQGKKQGKKNFILDTNELSILIPALPRPTLKELQKINKEIVKIEQDKSPTEPVTLKLVTVLCDDKCDWRTADEDRQQRFASIQFTLLGYQQLKWLIENQDEYPDLKKFYIENINIEFRGLTALTHIGSQIFPCSCAGMLRLGITWRAIDDLHVGNRIAVSGEQ